MTTPAAATLPLAHVLPIGAAVSEAGRLALGGCDVRMLVEEFGTPLYVYDVRTVQQQCAAYLTAFHEAYPESAVQYASKAYLSRPFARLIAAQGLGFDVVTAGEIEVLRAAEVEMAGVTFHGNNKTAEELNLALDAGVGRIVIDASTEIGLLERVATEADVVQPVLLRVSPGIDAQTHEKTTTGIVDSKFGLPIETGAAFAAVQAILAAEHLDFRGLHMHLGSPIFELGPYEAGIEVTLGFAQLLHEELGVEVAEFSPGGGFAVAYDAQEPPTPYAYANAIAAAVERECEARGLMRPQITVEPGRAIVGRAGVAIYTVGARKEIPGVRTFVSVDGGMADNIRPAMYDASYAALAADRPLAEAEETVTIAGKYCESGDLLVRGARLPRLEAGELLAIPAAGAYQLAMESNYNLAYRAAVVLVEDGSVRLIRRRETAEDLMRLDVE